MYETLIGKDIDIAAQLLADGELVGIPTETVYGLAANMFSDAAVRQIFEVKQRPSNNPLIVHVYGKDMLSDIVTGIPPEAKALLEVFSPGPLTVLLPKKSTISSIVTANLQHVAIRIPDHQLTLELLKKTGFPLVAPSANPYAYVSPTTAGHVKKMLDGRIPYVLDGGPCKRGLESTIIGFIDGIPTAYRLGAIPIDEMEQVIGKIKLAGTEKTVAPGMHRKHYSPFTKLVVSDDLEKDMFAYKDKKIGLITYNVFSELLPPEHQMLLCERDDFKNAGVNLYATMHTMDTKGYDVIIARKFPEAGLGAAINDRLNRAKAQ